MRVLFVEDSKHLRNYVAKALRRAGYATDTAADGEDGLEQALSVDYDVIVLDLMLPKLDGLSVLRELRADGSTTHVLILTARTQIADRVAGLELGADDYLVKPFAIEELVARVNVLVRRQYGRKTNEIQIGELRLDTRAKMVTLSGQEVALRPREYALLEYLATRRGQVVKPEEIEDHVYDHAKELKSNAVRSAICVSRKHLHVEGGPEYLRTVHGRGYQLSDGKNE